MTPAGEAQATETEALEELLQALRALEKAFVAWDQDGIVTHGAAARAALERARTELAREAKRGGKRVGEILHLTRRCHHLAEAGARLAGSMSRLGALTYAPAPADTKDERSGPGSRGRRGY